MQFNIKRKEASPEKSGLLVEDQPSSFGGAVAAANAAKEKSEAEQRKAKSSSKTRKP